MQTKKNINLDLYEFDLQIWNLAKKISEIDVFLAKGIGIGLDAATALAKADKKSVIRLASGTISSFKLASEESDIINFLSKAYMPSLNFESNESFDLKYLLKIKKTAHEDIERCVLFFDISRILAKTIASCTDNHLALLCNTHEIKITSRISNSILIENLCCDTSSISDNELRNLLFKRYQSAIPKFIK